MISNVDKFKYNDKYFNMLDKYKLLDILNNNKYYSLFLNIYKTEYIEHISKKVKNINILDYIKNDKLWTLKNDPKSTLFYLFFMKSKKPIAITKILTINKSNNTFTNIIKYLNCKYKDITYIYNTFILEKYRGKGINNLFIDFILNNIKSKYIIVIIHNNNIQSIKSYLKSGFIKTNILSEYDNSYFYYKTNNIV
jgi:RimJ/RimL family protein N-acetyltransferase